MTPVAPKCTYRQTWPLIYIIPALKQHRSKRHVEAAEQFPQRPDTDLGLHLLPLTSLAFHQCLDSIKSARRLSLFRVSYPTTMSTDVGREEMMRADSPLVSPRTPSSASSCLNVSITDDRPSTFNRQGSVKSAVICKYVSWCDWKLILDLGNKISPTSSF